MRDDDMKTETSMLQDRYEFDVRRRRADQLLAAIFYALDDLIEDKKEAYYRLNRLFLDEGVELITDKMREEMGLSPRGVTGWTREELAALDAHRLEALLRPISFPVLKTAKSSPNPPPHPSRASPFP